MNTLEKVMSTEPVVVAPTASLREAAELMRSHDIGMLPVVDGKRLVGIVTDRDLVVRGLAGGQAPTVKDVLTKTSWSHR